jgi:hypothetical protein
MTHEPVSESTFLIYLKPEQLSYQKGQTSEEVLFELETRVRNIQAKKYSSDKSASPFRPIERVLYGMKLSGTPGYGLLKLVQMYPTSVYKKYLYADISDHARIYVEVVDDDTNEMSTSEGKRGKQQTNKSNPAGRKKDSPGGSKGGGKSLLPSEDELEEEVFSPETEPVEKKVFIFMVCDRHVRNYSNMLSLI